MANVFPELKESEDERIRKELIDFIKHESYMYGIKTWCHGYTTEEIISWLEKQGEKDKLIQELGEYKVKYTQETLEKALTMNNKDDERLRKTTISFLKEFADKGYENAVECIDWLEKQCEQKTIDKSESKFKIEKGKWYVCIKDLLDNYTNKAFYEGDTYLSTQDGSLIPSNSNVSFEVVCPDTYFREWTTQDAKDSDVLVASDGSIFLFAGVDDYACKYYAALTADNYVKINKEAKGGYWETSRAVHPATKEQRDLLFQKMKEEGYEWNTEKKELKKIGQKSVWSEDDELMLLSIIQSLEPTNGAAQMKIDWLKSLEQRIGQGLNPDKVIEWLKPYGCVVGDIVEQFRKDFL